MLKDLIKKKDTILIILVIISVGLLIFAQLLYPSSFLALFLDSIKKSHIGKNQPLDLAKWRATLHSLSALCFISAITLSLWFYSDLIESKLPLPIKRTIRNLTPRIFIVIVLVSSLLSFFSSLVVNFLTHSFADGWWTATAQLLNDKTLLYRDVEIWTTPLRVLIAYYLNQLGPILLWEKLFGLVVLLTIWFGLWRLNFFLTRNIFISLAFTTISVSIGQMFVATIYYDYNLITIMLGIVIVLAETQRLKVERLNFSRSCLWLMVVGLLSGLSVLNKYTDGFIFLLFILVYFTIYFSASNQGVKSWRKLLVVISAFVAGVFASLLIVWLLGFSIIDFYEIPSVLMSSTEAKGVNVYSLISIFFRLFFSNLSNIFSGQNFFLVILPFLLIFNSMALTQSLYSVKKKHILSVDQRFICLLMTFMGWAVFLTNLLSGGGRWENFPYFFNLIPISVLSFIDLKNNGIFNTKLLKISVIFLSLISIPFSIKKTLKPYNWLLPSGQMRPNNFEFSSSGYYAYLPINKRYGKVVDDICSALSDHKAAVISYPVPFANLACAKKYPLTENIFWYDVADSQKIYTLLNWLRDNSKRPVYVVFFYNHNLLTIHEKMFGLKPAHRELESYLLAQEALGNNAQYILKHSIRYQRVTVKIYKSISK
jgi:hypothetical protein